MIPKRLRATVPGPQPSPLLARGPSSPFPGWGTSRGSPRAGPDAPSRALPGRSLLSGVGGGGGAHAHRGGVPAGWGVGAHAQGGGGPAGWGGAGSRTRRWCPRSCPGSRRGARARGSCSPAAGGPEAGGAPHRSTLGRVRGCAEVSRGRGRRESAPPPRQSRSLTVAVWGAEEAAAVLAWQSLVLRGPRCH